VRCDPLIEGPTAVTFRLACPDERAWVVFGKRGEAGRVLEMTRPAAGVWSARADVSPGDYSCRCYGGTARAVTYFGPPQVDGGTDGGMETLLTVGRPQA
jgi:hypothetical protein